MKKSLLLLIPSLFLVAACGKEPAGPVEPDKKPCNPGPCVDADEDGFCDVCGYPVELKHATSVSGDPSASFYLKVGEEKNIKATLSPTPTRKSEKTFKWKTSSSSIATVTPQEDTAKAVVKGMKTGSVVFTATNDYNTDLVRQFYANVINYDDANMYLWEYKSEDRAKFGYVNVDGQKQGVPDGIARLGIIDWTFHRSNTTSLQSASGSLGFGKGDEPETLVTLKAENDRPIKKITIETSSANALSNVTVKVGDNEVINSVTPKYVQGEPMGSVTYVDETEAPNKYNGDILIQFDTPEFDPTRADDPTYRAPGAVYLKSIWIEYYDLEYKTTQTYDFEEMYADPESEMSKQITSSTTGKEFVLEDDKFILDIKKARKGDDKGNQFFESNSDITITAKEADEVIKSVEFNWETLASKKYTLKSSMFAGELYPTTYTNSNTGKLSLVLSEAHANSILFESSNTSYIGLKSIIVKTISGEHAKVKNVELENNIPTKTNYIDGEQFDPAGLGDVLVSFTNSEIPVYKLPISYVTFYDGPSYDEPADHSGKTTALSEGTTYVVGPILGHDLKVENLTVTMSFATLTRVTAASDLTTGDYLFVIPGSSKYWKGSMSNADMKKTASIGDLGDIEFNDTISVSSSLLKDALSITNDSGNFTIKNQSGGKIGMTKSGNIGIAAGPDFSIWSGSVSDKFVDFVINGKDKDGNDLSKHLVFTTIFELDDASSSNIALYKVNK